MASFVHSNRPHSFPSIYSYDPTVIPSPLSSPQFYLDQSALHTFFAGPVGMLSSKSSRMRRKSSSTLDQVKKHRRTRSGCLTCRHRRVKCDEAHPICDRCAKGGRECSYPEPSPSKSSSISSSSKGKKERKDAPTSDTNSVKDITSSPESNLYDDDETYHDTDEAEYSMASSPVDPQFLRPSVTFPSYTRRASSKSASPFLGPSSSRSSTFPTRAIEETHPEAGSPTETTFKTDYSVNSHSPRVNSTNSNPVFRLSLVEGRVTPDMNFYLGYHQQAITCEHYMLKTDSSGFFKTQFIHYATSNDALLHAVVAFSAFHYHVNHPSNQYEDFLEYYNKALALLRLSFVSGSKPGLATLMTILQLAIFEEYLGDWSNLIQHRKGAHQLLISLYSAETISETAEGAMIFSWFTRLDNFVAIMCGQEVILGKEWYEVNRSFCQTQKSLNSSVKMIIAQAESEARFMTMEVANLLSRRSRGMISSETFLSYGATIQENINQFWGRLHPNLASIHRNVNQFQVSMESNAYAQNPQFYQEDEDYLRPALYIFADVHVLGLILMHHTSLARGIHHEYMLHHALSVCKIYTAMETYINQAPHLLFPLFTSLCMATVWMPDTQHAYWFRSKMSNLENMGLLLPIAFRAHLSSIWDEPDLRFSWLPHAQAISSTTSLSGGIIMSIKNLAEIRDSELPTDQVSHDIRRINNLFGYVDIDEPALPAQESYLSFPEFNRSGLFTTTYDEYNENSNQFQ